jgi:hypothetical protein
MGGEGDGTLTRNFLNSGRLPLVTMIDRMSGAIFELGCRRKVAD